MRPCKPAYVQPYAAVWIDPYADNWCVQLFHGVSRRYLCARRGNARSGRVEMAVGPLRPSALVGAQAAVTAGALRLFGGTGGPLRRASASPNRRERARNVISLS